jgi:hypothetical protein
LWNQGVQTEVLPNRPDKDRICLLIVVAMPSHSNIIQMEAERKLKYKKLGIEIQ